MFISFLVAYLLVSSTFIECGPLAKSSSLKNDSTSLTNSSLFNASSLSSGDVASLLSNESYELTHQLSSDDTKPAATNVGSSVLFDGQGKAKLRMPGRLLKVNVNLKSCIGPASFCYKASKVNDKAKNGCPSNYCGFKLWSNDTHIGGINFAIPKTLLRDEITSIRLKYDLSSQIYDPSCDPAFEDGNLLSIEAISVSQTCSIEIPDSQVYHEPEPTLPSSGNDKASKTSDNGTPWYAWLLVPVTIVAILILVGVVIGLCWVSRWCCFKKYSTPSSPNPSIIVPAGSLRPSMRTIEEIKMEPSVDEKKMKPKKKKDKKKKAAKKEKSLPTAREPTIEATMPSVTCDEISLPISVPHEEYLKLPPPPPKEVLKQKKRLKARPPLCRSKYNSIEEAKKRIQQG